MDRKSKSKFIRKITKNAWYETTYGTMAFKYRFISIHSEDMWRDEMMSVKCNIEVKDIRYIESDNRLSYFFTHYDRRRLKRKIRQYFSYNEKNDMKYMLMFFNVQPRRIDINLINLKDEDIPQRPTKHTNPQTVQENS